MGLVSNSNPSGSGSKPGAGLTPSCYLQNASFYGRGVGMGDRYS